MREDKRWLLRKNKVPYYVDGTLRRGELDSELDLSRLGTFDQALDMLKAGGFDGIGFALGPDGTGNHWQGIDLDNVEANGLQALANSLVGYVEYSPSGLGRHAIGYGKPFEPLKLKGIEAYSGKRYFTFSGHAIRGELTDLAPFVATHLEPLRVRPVTAAPLEAPSAPTRADADIVGMLNRDPALAPLCNGTSGGNPSEDDLSLVNAIAFRSRNRAQTERIWLASPLGQRDKTQRRADYRQRTLDAAFNFPELPPLDLSSINCKGEPLSGNGPTAAPKAEPTIVDAGDWQGQPLALRKYILAPFIPAGLVTVLIGDGGGGKSLLGQQLASSTALSTRFLGLTPMAGTALIVNCEDDLSELHRRQIDICAALQKPLSALKGKLFFAALGGGINNELAVFNAQGVMTLTAAYSWLEATAHKYKPDLILLDNVAHLFAGNENIRNQVAAFLGLLNALAAETGAAIVLIAHPNKEQNYSGSTAWNNQVRNRLKLEIPKDDNGNVLDPDARVLSVEKSNYNRAGQRLEFRWHKGAFVLESDLPADVAAQVKANNQNAADDAVFLACLAERTRQRRAVSELVSKSYAPTVFARMAESQGIGKTRLEAAMDRLFRAGTIERGFLWRDTAEGKDRHGLREISANGPANGPPTPSANDRQLYPPTTANTLPISKDIGEGGPEGPLPPKGEEGGAPWPDLP
jgi:RecA-family ATPase